MNRRRFLHALGAGAAVSVVDWLGFFRRHGVPGTPGDWAIADARAASGAADGGPDAPSFLVYWFLEGGWDSYSMFGPVDTGNDATRSFPPNTLNPTPSWSSQFYRARGYPTLPYGPSQQVGNIRAGFLAQPGAPLFNDMAVVSSHHGSAFHSGSRFDYHYGSYNRALTSPRLSTERSVLQAFAEAKGAGFLMPHVSWHRWLADGELSPSNYPEGTGYYEKLGPPYAHTNYGLTPSAMRQRLLGVGDIATQQRRSALRVYTDDLHSRFLHGRDGQSVRAFSSALQIHRTLTDGNISVDPRTMFTDPALLAEFGIASQAEMEETTSTSINGNPARSKQSPHVKTQAVMAYELMRAGISCAFWLESRDLRRFDTHGDRKSAVTNQGQTNQLARMQEELWSPLAAFAARLKSTPCPGFPSATLWDRTTIVVASEMGRTIQGDVGPILTGTGTVDDMYTAIMTQDVCQHWATSSVAFLGGNVRGNTQWGAVGTSTLDSIPVMPDGSLDPAFDPVTGVLLPGQTQSPSSYVSNAGNVYATALLLAGVDPAGKGLNTRPAMAFVQKP
jgi:hypothetical protein